MKKLLSLILALGLVFTGPIKANPLNAKTYLGLGCIAAGVTSAGLAFKFYSDYEKYRNKGRTNSANLHFGIPQPNTDKQFKKSLYSLLACYGSGAVALSTTAIGIALMSFGLSQK